MRQHAETRAMWAQTVTVIRSDVRGDTKRHSKSTLGNLAQCMIGFWGMGVSNAKDS